MTTPRSQNISRLTGLWLSLLALSSASFAEIRYVQHEERLTISSAEFRDWQFVVRLGGVLIVNDGAVLGSELEDSGRIYVENNGSLIIDGGVFGGEGISSGRIMAKDTSSVVINGGTFGGGGDMSGRIDMLDKTTLTIRGGSFGAGRATGSPVLFNEAIATVTGGSFGGFDFGSGQIELYHASKLVIEGGQFGGNGEESGRVLATDQAQVEIRGGTYGGAGRAAGSLRPNANSLWAILACDFNLPPGVNTFPAGEYVTLTATFQSGEQLSTLIYREPDVSVELRSLAICGDQTAIRLDVASGNPIRVNEWGSTELITTIYAECDPHPSDYAFATHPFSGVANEEAILRARVSTCPLDPSYSPTVGVNWSVEGTPLAGNAQWTGSEGLIHIAMPNLIGSFTVNLQFSVNGGPPKLVSRRLLVTRRAPVVADLPPRLSSFERAIEWSSGLLGTSSDFEILSTLLNSMFTYGATHWRYGGQGIFFGLDGPGCDGRSFPFPFTERMLADPSDPGFCGDSSWGNRCYTFTDILETTARILGVGGTVPHAVWPKELFVTVKAPSLDPGFPGNSFDFATGLYDRYLFSSHSLLKAGSIYFDATYGNIYANDQEFIAFRFDGNTAEDELGRLYNTTLEGARVYLPYPAGIYAIPGFFIQYPFIYTWGSSAYVEPELGPSNARFAFQAITAVVPPVLTGDADYSAVDNDGDGFAESLAVDIALDVPAAGAFIATGRLEKEGTLVANQPVFRSQTLTSAQLAAVPGINTIRLVFSGERILRSGVDGPYDLKVQVVGVGPGNHATAVLQTPPLDHKQFGELAARLVSASESGVDADGDGLLDEIRLVISIDVSRPDEYQILGNLSKSGLTLAGSAGTLQLAAGLQQAELGIPGAQIRRHSVDGPFTAVVLLEDKAGEPLGSLELPTAAYLANNFASFAEPVGPWTEEVVDNNANGLGDLLRVDQSFSIATAGDYIVSAKLFRPGGNASVYADAWANLVKGNNVVSWSFSGPSIFAQQLDGPYQLEVVFRDATTGAQRDRLLLTQLTAPYDHRHFDDTFRAGSIQLTETFSETAIDTNDNGKFDELIVDLGVVVPGSAIYEWSARLEDSTGKEIDFDVGQAPFAEGAATIQLRFDGKAIGQNGVDGPFFVRGLVMFAPGHGSLLASQAAETRAYEYTRFEGASAQGDLDGDGDIDRDDLAVVVAGRGSPAEGPDDPRDLDGDGQITALDARKLVTLFTRPGGATH